MADTMFVKYQGRSAQVELGPTGVVARRGDTVEVPKDVGENLVENAAKSGKERGRPPEFVASKKAGGGS